MFHGAPKVRGIFEKVKGSSIWWVRYTDASGRERREKAGTRAVAQKLWAKRVAEALQGKKLPESLRRKAITFGNLCDAALEYSRANKASYPQDACRIPLLKKALGHRPAAEITPREVEGMLRRLADEYQWSPATLNRMKSLVSLAYRLGVQEGLVNSNPARLVRQWKAENRRVRFLSDEEERRLREVIAADCPQHMPEFELALHTGMRASEQYGMVWDCVDFERQQITLLATKNGHVRYVPLNAAAQAALLTLRRAAVGGGAVFINAVTPGRYRGKPRQTARNWFEHCVRRAALPDFTWHCLRHTFASRLVMAGVDLRTVAELLGHRTLAMVMRYAHLAPSHLQDAVAKLVSPELGTSQRIEPGGAGQTGTRTGTGMLDGSAIKSQVV